jgi:hypothetical protein
LLNLSLVAAMLTITAIINNLLAGGLNINWLIEQILGTYIFYFPEFTMIEQEEMLFIKLTPGIRLIPPFITPSPASFKVPGFGNMLTTLVEENQKRAGGIEEYVTEKIERMFNDL